MTSPQARHPATATAPLPDTPLALLGGLTPRQFMRRHWQKKPLLIRQAMPGFAPLLDRAELFALAGQEGVESRAIVRQAGGDWRLSHGPLARKALPPFKQPAWTLLVQGVDLHVDAVHRLMQGFRFVPDARLDDLMISWASEGGGVGPHFDSYDVFLLQASGKRHWRIGRQKDLTLQEGVPLKILQHFEPEEEWVLEPGDMLYLPPKWAHDGVAVDGECMTYSVGFRAPQRGGLAGELALRLADEHEDEVLYRDPQQVATDQPAAVPAGLLDFARDGLQRLLADDQALGCALGEVLTEPKPKVWFEEPVEAWATGAVRLDRRTRMLYDERHIFINGEAFRAGGRDARLMRELADRRGLDAERVQRASAEAQALLADWHDAGWLHLDPEVGGD
ncbi:cupin domain-containing protein [Aquabacterium sp. A08]|uniref:cupin domain-containing protein n=1 Tax=Aquabacterium sp. A08 TaxID=2718532 RepID=UPI0014241047|nr:cupin domain-containing protein [Aquabacterium sp. A08]NIC41774.1 cupin domain-containing protein [Aquabacterium sp. A08]NIC41803.1 cupin domain-containing protein [Aquabacterium sp. A08]